MSELGFTIFVYQFFAHFCHVTLNNPMGKCIPKVQALYLYAGYVSVWEWLEVAHPPTEWCPTN